MRAYDSFLPSELRQKLWSEAVAVAAVEGLRVDANLLEKFPEWLTPKALGLVIEVYREVCEHLDLVLRQRVLDREFIDTATLSFSESNEKALYLTPSYKTCIGMRDDAGRVVEEIL